MRTIKFKGFEVDVFSDEEVFSRSVYPTGMKGFEQLTQTLRDNGCFIVDKIQHFQQYP